MCFLVLLFFCPLLVCENVEAPLLAGTELSVKVVLIYICESIGTYDSLLF